MTLRTNLHARCEMRDADEPGSGMRDAGCVRHTAPGCRSEEHTSELQSRVDLVCRLLLEKKKKTKKNERQHADTGLDDAGDATPVKRACREPVQQHQPRDVSASSNEAVRHSRGRCELPTR